MADKPFYWAAASMPLALAPLDFDVYNDEASIRLAAERIRVSIGKARGARSPGATEQRAEPRFGNLTGAFLIPVKVNSGRARQVAPASSSDRCGHFPARHWFQHVTPLMHKTHVLTCDTWTDKPVSLLIERRWTRREDESVFGYRSGFTIRGVASEHGIPLAEAEDQPGVEG